METAIQAELANQNFVLRGLFFDWFSCGVECSFPHLLVLLERTLENVDFQEITPRSGYAQAFKVAATGISFIAMFGGSNVGTRMMLQASGGDAEPFRSWFLSVFAQDEGSLAKYDPVLIRADVAVDFDEPGVYADLTSVLIGVAESHRLKKACLGDWIAPSDPKGRTLYIGSRQSPVMARLYEKGKTLVDVRPDLARLELEIKPKRIAARRQYVTLSARDLVFCNAWTTALFVALSGVSYESSALPPGTVHRDTDHERAFAHLVKQYRSTIKKELDLRGGDYVGLLSSLLGESVDV